MLIDAGGDVSRVDDDNIPAMTDVDVEFWYKSHETIMLSMIGFPNLKGFDHPIFADPRTQHAIDKKWHGKTRNKLFTKLFNWVLFVFFLVVMVTKQFERDLLTSRQTRAYQGVEEVLVNEPFQSDLLAFEDIANAEELWAWFGNVFIPAVYPSGASTYRTPNGSVANVGMKSIANFNYVIGKPRIRTTRSKLKPKCSRVFKTLPNDGYCMEEQEAPGIFTMLGIYTTFNQIDGDTQDPFVCPGIGNIPFITSKSNTLYSTASRAFRYRSDSYMLKLPSPNHVNATADIKTISDNIVKCNFVDLNTRMIVFELVTINPSLNDLIITVELFVEFDVNGVVYPNFNIKQTNLFTEGDNLLYLVKSFLLVFSFIYLLGELDELSTLEWNGNVRNLWPKFYSLSIEKRQKKSEKLKEGKTDQEKDNFTDEIVTLSHLLQRSLYFEVNNISLPAPTPFISLRYAAAVAKTATEDTSDRHSIKLHIYMPWRKSKKPMLLDFFPADTHESVMERLKQEAMDIHGEVILGETVLQIAQRPRDLNDTIVTIPDDDSINDLYLLLRGVREDILTKDKDKNQKQKEFYRFSFIDVPKELNLVFRFIIEPSKSTGSKVTLTPIGSPLEPVDLDVVSKDTIGHVITKLADKLDLHRRGIQILSVDKNILQCKYSVMIYFPKPNNL